METSTEYMSSIATRSSSLAAVFSSKRCWNSRVSSSRLTRSERSRPGDVQLACGADDDVDAVALVEGTEAVVHGMRRPALALRHVAAAGGVPACARVPG